MEEQVKTDSHGTIEAMLVQAFVEYRGTRAPTCKELVNSVIQTEEQNDSKLKYRLTPKMASSILRTMGFTTTHTNRGAVATIEQNRLNALLSRFGIDRKP
jgi:hypothetical protein